MTDYTDFKKMFEAYQDYASNTTAVHETGNISIPARGLAVKSIVDYCHDDSAQKTMLNSTANAQKIFLALNYGTKKTNEKANKFAEDNLEGILGGFKREDLIDSIMITKPRDSYTDKKPKTYTDIANLQKKVGEMGQIISKKDTKKMTMITKNFYEDKFKAPEDKGALELAQSFLKIDSELAIIKFQELYMEAGKAFEDKLKGNEVGYLTETLKGEDFVQFYGGFLEFKKQIAEDRSKQ